MGKSKRQHVGAGKITKDEESRGYLEAVREYVKEFAKAISGAAIVKYDPISEYTFVYHDPGANKPNQIIVYNEYGEFHTEWVFKRSLISDRTEALQQILDAIASGRYQ